MGKLIIRSIAIQTNFLAMLSFFSSCIHHTITRRAELFNYTHTCLIIAKGMDAYVVANRAIRQVAHTWLINYLDNKILLS